MGLTEEVRRLGQVPFLSVLDERALEIIAFNAERLHASNDMTLFFEGEPSDGALFVWSGSVSLQALINGELKERVRLQEGAVADPYAAISEGRRTLTAKAVGDVTYLKLDRGTFLKLMNIYPDQAEKVQAYLANDIQNTASSLSGVAARLDFIS